MISPTHLHHFAITVTDAEKTVDYYKRVFHAKSLRRPNFDFQGAWLLVGGVQIHVIQNLKIAAVGDGEINSRDNHVAFAVANIENVKSHLEAINEPFVERVNAGGTHQIFIQDPDGHEIELAEYGAASDEIVPELS